MYIRKKAKLEVFSQGERQEAMKWSWLQENQYRDSTFAALEARTNNHYNYLNVPDLDADSLKKYMVSLRLVKSHLTLSLIMDFILKQ